MVSKLSERRGELVEMRPSGGGRQRLIFYVPTRGLIGYQGELLTNTRGTAIMNRLFHEYAPYKGEMRARNGVLISNSTGEAVAYALWNLEDRGRMMIDPQTRVYPGMIVGEHTRENDLEVNVLKGKQLTNIRTTSKDEAVRLTPPMRLPLEKALAFIQDDELVEVTPKSIRLRKRYLDSNERKRVERAAAQWRRRGARVSRFARPLPYVLSKALNTVAPWLVRFGVTAAALIVAKNLFWLGHALLYAFFPDTVEYRNALAWVFVGSLFITILSLDFFAKNRLTAFSALLLALVVCVVWLPRGAVAGDTLETAS